MTTVDKYKVYEVDPTTGQAVGSSSAKGTRTFSTFAPTTTAAAATPALAANTSRKEALIYNNGAQTVYLGRDAQVTTATGLPLVSGATLRDDRATGAWYAITASGTGDLRILEVA